MLIQGQLGKGVERFAVAKEPGFGDDDGLDQFVQFVVGRGEEVAVGVGVFQPVLFHAQPNGPLDQGGADRGGVEADVAAEQGFNAWCHRS